jgi:CRP-like cAMP-binding protein
MALSASEQQEVWEIIKDSPLVARWGDDFRTGYLPTLSIKTVRANAPVYKPGDPPLYLYIVLEGSVIQRLTDGAQTWLEQEYKPGQFFGQHALFSGEYTSTTRAGPRSDVRLLEMLAWQLRVAMERDPDLYEVLLHEKRAARMRRLPLLRDLKDDQVRRLAEAVEEREFAAGEEIPLKDRPGVWVVDTGQVSVTGNANPHETDGWDKWRITAGNFIVTPSDGAGADLLRTVGARRIADTAEAHVKSRLFYIPAVHLERLLNLYPDIKNLVREPVAIVELLNGQNLFLHLDAGHVQHLAQFVAWQFVPVRQNITTQGENGYEYIILREGSALITAFDDSGRERPKNREVPIWSYGTTSLLENKPRDATVRGAQGRGAEGAPGLEGADLLVLDRRDLQYAFVERPDLWNPDVALFRDFHQVKQEKVPFEWMREGEVLIWRDRPHWLWLIAPELVIFAGAAAVIAIMVWLLPGLGVRPGLTAFLILGLVTLPFALLAIPNYFNDYFAITNRRVTRRDAGLVLYEYRVEAPVDQIQDVTVVTDFLGRVFGFGDVTMRSAARGAPIVFNDVPRPYMVQGLIEGQRSEARAARQGQQKEELRSGLMSGLQLALAAPPLGRALGDAPLPNAPTGRRRFGFSSRQPVAVPTKPSATRFLHRATRWLSEDTRLLLFGPPPVSRTSSDAIVWRKHWISLVRRAGMPFLTLMLLLIGGGALLTRIAVLFAIGTTAVGLAWLFLMTLTGGWLWWRVVDYRNDTYSVTNDRIIDVEMKPFGLSSQRREGGLEKVQNVVAVQSGLLPRLLDYGDVVISTAASDEGFTFLTVPHPKVVQATVFERLDAFRRQQEQRRAAERQRELIEGIEVYHRLLGKGGLPPRWEEER